MSNGNTTHPPRDAVLTARKTRTRNAPSTRRHARAAVNATSVITFTPTRAAPHATLPRVTQHEIDMASIVYVSAFTPAFFFVLLDVSLILAFLDAFVVSVSGVIFTRR